MIKRNGFTLVELLVVVGIIAVLVGVLLPALYKARKASNDVYCRSNLRQVAIATRMYANDNADHYPDGYTLGGAVARVLPGMKSPGDPNAVPEVYGLPALYYDRGYIKELKTWMCPGARDDVKEWGNTYIWNLLGGTELSRVQDPRPGNAARWTSLKRNRFENLNFYFVWDNYTTYPWTSGSRRTSGTAGTFAITLQQYPHSFNAKGLIGRRQGSINCMFLDGHVGVVTYIDKGGTSPVSEVIREP